MNFIFKLKNVMTDDSTKTHNSSITSDSQDKLEKNLTENSTSLDLPTNQSVIHSIIKQGGTI
jgi:hypothetical protein